MGPPSALPALLVVILSTLLLGSECQEDPESDPVIVVDRSFIEPIDDAWESSPWIIEDIENEGLIDIVPATRIQLFHGLGRAPLEVHTYVGFAPDATRIMPASGNASEIHDVGYEDGCPYAACDYIIIRNGSGGSFFYRFVLR